MSDNRILSVTYPRAILYGLVVLLAATLVFAASTSGSAFGLYNTGWDGASGLRSTASDSGTPSRIIQNTTAYRTVEASGSIAFVLSPERNYTTQEAARLEAFVRDGGTLVVADDRSVVGNQLLASLNTSARLDNATLRDERYNFKSPVMPVARNVSNHTLTQDVSSLTLNYGTAVRSGNATVLVNSSDYAYLDRDGNGNISENESIREYPVITAERLGNGRIIVVSDPSIFINSMLERSGNDAFATRLIETHDRVLLDYSHQADLPLLVQALLLIRNTPIVQFLLGTSAVAVIVMWESGLIARATENIQKRYHNEYEQTSQPSATATDLATHLRHRHPEWDENRVERIVESIQTRRSESSDRNKSD